MMTVTKPLKETVHSLNFFCFCCRTPGVEPSCRPIRFHNLNHRENFIKIVEKKPHDALGALSKSPVSLLDSCRNFLQCTVIFYSASSVKSNWKSVNCTLVRLNYNIQQSTMQSICAQINLHNNNNNNNNNKKHHGFRFQCSKIRINFLHYEGAPDTSSFVFNKNGNFVAV